MNKNFYKEKENKILEMFVSKNVKEIEWVLIKILPFQWNKTSSHKMTMLNLKKICVTEDHHLCVTCIQYSFS